MEKNPELEKLFADMRQIQQHFLNKYGVNDIWSNSKIYEVLQANTLGHRMIPGHSGSLDAMDSDGRQYEYKHFKESSSNHSWTFNDYSSNTISKLWNEVEAVIFAHIDDTIFPPRMDWSFTVSGKVTSEYLKKHTKGIRNTRKMINLSANQLETRVGSVRIIHDRQSRDGAYTSELKRIFEIISKLEEIVGTSNILTSNKFWEVLVSLPLGHTVNSEQGGRAGAHDAYDLKMRDYEYKVSSTNSWNFQDISPQVLSKYLNCEEIVLAVVDKTGIKLKSVWFAKPNLVVKKLKQKLKEKEIRFLSEGKEIRRLQVSISSGDLTDIGARKII
jgi:hypothetical protein